MPWQRHAAQWHLIGSPLRPAPEDVAMMQRAVDSIGGDAFWCAVLLGVTPEIVNLAWPRAATLVACDVSGPMIDAQWRAPAGIRSLAIQGLWETLPVGAGRARLVLADGSLSALSSPTALRRVLERVAASLCPAGRFVLRAYVRPARPEPAEDVLGDLLGGRVTSVHVAKWRLAMALHGTLEEGVRLDDVWAAFRRAVPDSVPLARRTGWPVEEIDTVDVYRGVTGRYLFPTLPELRQLTRPWFTEISCEYPSYALGERCPTLTFRLH